VNGEPRRSLALVVTAALLALAAGAGAVVVSIVLAAHSF
jgi:hypothetical protein